MPWTPAQNHLFRAIEHGWHPPADSGIHIPVATATKMAHEGIKRAHGGLAYLPVQQKGVGGTINRVARLLQRPFTHPNVAAEAVSDAEPLTPELSRQRFDMALDKMKSLDYDLANRPVTEGQGAWLDDHGELQTNPLYMQRLPRTLGRVDQDQDALHYASDLGQLLEQKGVPVARSMPSLIDTPDGSNAVLGRNLNAGAISQLARSLGQDTVVALQPGDRALMFPLNGEDIASLRARAQKVLPDASFRYGASDPGVDRVLVGSEPWMDMQYSQFGQNPRTAPYSELERRLLGLDEMPGEDEQNVPELGY